MAQPSSLSIPCDVRRVHPDAVAAAAASLAERQESLSAAGALFVALGDPTRLWLLAALQVGPLCTCDLAATLGVSESAVSHQLRSLRPLHLVASGRDGRVVYHRLDDGRVEALLAVADAHVANGVAIPEPEVAIRA